jgi:hypothetical protein
MYFRKAGVAETAKAVVRQPRFAVHFFQHLPDGDGGRPTPGQANTLQNVLLAMIENASGAPGARRRLETLADETALSECAFSTLGKADWIAGLMASFEAVDPNLPAEAEAKIRTLFERQADQLVELADAR